MLAASVPTTNRSTEPASSVLALTANDRIQKQIIAILREQEAELPMVELCRKHGMSDACQAAPGSDPWRHEELTPLGMLVSRRLVQVVHGRAPPAARLQARAVGRREQPTPRPSDGKKLVAFEWTPIR